jgi:dolichyl-phosphate beta-glucosyltransferase
MGVIPIRDMQCGFKVFTREAANAIFCRSRIDGLMFDNETISNAKKMGFKLSELPVTRRDEPDTRFDPIGEKVSNFEELCEMKFPSSK